MDNSASGLIDKRVRILSLNGGGVRGLYTINVLAEIERIIAANTGGDNANVGDYFDLVTGTSIGGILALGLAAGKSARDLESIFHEKAPIIFPELRGWFIQWRYMLKGSVGPLYKSAPLENAVKDMVGPSTTFNDLSRRIVIPAVNLSTGKPQFFKTPHNPKFNRDGKLKLVDAAMATSAAPVYFKPHYCEDLKAYFADGGLVANNPSYIGMLEVFRDMRSDFPNSDYSDVHILNIGTLGEEYTISPKALLSRNSGYLGLWGGGKRLVLATMTANQILHRNMLERDLYLHDAKDNYLYIDDMIPNEAASDITLDNATESTLRNLSGRGRQKATEEFTKNMSLRAFFDKKALPFKDCK
ncbi:CBASS cGAMP-activated phospholipase [Gilvimarinus algae]|uniref:CBASS cGAMP-activated phospholipase n=1 Tax=Gilvimarinus algae TaxID=3058037 RepID=A0ABT8TE63_9GAMM|nr:CBASS cGAMP-activated phospholipase [Gilvimarinus sp. SDUM040014]MDO3382396.1 CBASS cGAMP-activated phospholipase [Gilvimarinus sp. SDUM040014]